MRIKRSIVALIFIMSSSLATDAELPIIKIQKKGESFTHFCYALYVVKTARRLEIPVRIALRLAEYESQWDYMARSNKGAEGLYQLMPGLHDYFMDKFNNGQPFSEFRPSDSIKIGLAYLKYLYDETGSWRNAIMSYNCGPNFNAITGYWPKESIDLARNVLGKE